MKSSFIPALLWLTNVAALGAGGYFAWDLHKTQRDERADINKQIQTFLTPGKGPKDPKRMDVEDWHEFLNDGPAIQFSGVRLQPGEKPRVPDEPLKPIVDTKPPEPAKPDLGKIRDGVARELQEKFEVVRIWYAPKDLGIPSWTTVSLSKSGKKLIDLYEGLNLLQVFKKDIEKEPRLEQSLMNATVTSIGPASVLFSVSTVELQTALGKFTPQELEQLAGKYLLTDGRLTVELTIAAASGMSAEEMWGLNSPPPGSKPAIGKPSTTLPSKPPDDVVKIAGEMQPDADEWEYKEEDRETRIEKDGSVRLGGNQMNDNVFEDLSRYAGTYINPRTKEAEGIKVADNLPQDQNNLAYRVGARPGDIVKSINGQTVKNMQEIRSVVVKQRNAGVETFNVVFVRNGVEQTKVFNVPKKQAKGKK